MYKLCTIILMLGMSFSAVAVETRAGRDLVYFSSGELHHLVGEPESSVRDYLKSIRDKLGHENAHRFPLDYYKYGKYGTGHFSFQQTYNGIPVFGRYIRVHIQGSIITSISSNIDDIDISVIPVITKSGAMDIIRPNYISTSTYLKYQNLQIYIHNSIPHLIHSIDAVSFEDAWRYMVDAHTGDVVDRFPLIYEEGPAIGSGINLLSETVDTLYVYEGSSFTPIGQDIVTPYLLCEEYCFDYGDCGGDSYSDCMITPQQGDCEDGYILDCDGECFNDWYMQFPGVGNGFCNDPWLDYAEEDIVLGPYNMVDESNPELGNIYTINSYGGFYTDLSYVNSETTEFTETSTSLSHKSGVSAHDYQRKTLDYFWNHHGYAGIDGNGKRTISVVNYTNVAGGLDQRNAFYNAALDALTYGLGGNGYRPFCAAQDIVTHEFAHGFTAHTSGLIYRNQAGAINESMSDVFGYLVEAEYQDGGDWTQGEDVHYSGASRSFINPPDYNQPDHVGHPYFVEYNPNPQWSNDFGGVHYNSGITNKIMYLVIAGDTHYDIEVPPFEEDLNISRGVAANIWFAWSSYYLDPEDNFEIGREKMLQACNDLYPNNFNYYQTIASAWASTGIGSEIVSIPGDVNEDQSINILDIVALANIILNGNPDETQLYLGDLNSDGSINILDIIELVNLILGS